MAKNSKTREIEFKLIRNVGTIAEYQSGWTKELNVIAWNGGAPKFDIRDWDPEHDHMSRGITLHESEVAKLFELLQSEMAEELPLAE